MKKFFLMALMAFVSVAASAQSVQIKVATGTSTGTYTRMFKELNALCKDTAMMVEVPSAGSDANMDKLVGNEVNAGFVQTDVLFYRQRTEDLSDLKTLFALYPEEVHVLTTTVGKIKPDGIMNTFSSAITFNTVEQLTGRKVAAWGGSITTARIVKLQSDINYQIVEVDNFNTARALLDKGEVAAIIMVGGQKLGDIDALTRDYKLIPFSEASIAKMKSVYVPAKLNYNNLSQSNGVQTIATETLFVTRSYSTAKYVNSLAALRSCFNDNLDNLKETTGTHRKWRDVKAGNMGKWAVYQLPEAMRK